MSSLIKCPSCEKTLEHPVVLPCGDTICKSHVVRGTIKCPKCDADHDIPEAGFPINSLVEELLKNELAKLDLGPGHKVAVESFKELKKILEQIKRIQDDPKLEINCVISDLKNKIDLRREKEKKRIDDEALELIQKLEQCENECYAALDLDKVKMSPETQKLIESLESQLVTWDKELNSFLKNQKKWKKIHEVTVEKYKLLRKEMDCLEKNLFVDEFSAIQLKQKEYCQKNPEILM